MHQGVRIRPLGPGAGLGQGYESIGNGLINATAHSGPECIVPLAAPSKFDH